MTTPRRDQDQRELFQLVHKAPSLQKLKDERWLASQGVSGQGPYLYRLFGPGGVIHRTVQRNGVLSGINITQLRKIFNEVQQVANKARRDDSGWQRVLQTKLPPLLAYAYGRGHLGSRPAYDLLRELLSPERVKSREDAEVMGEVFQAILGYRKMEERRG